MKPPILNQPIDPLEQLKQRVARGIMERGQNSREVALPEFYATEFGDWTKKGRIPKPHFVPVGKRIVILQDPEERISAGGIIIPDATATKVRPTTGVVIGWGNGYDPDHPLWDEWEYHTAAEQPHWRCIYAIGDRVIWGRYHGDTRIGTTVEPDWWDEGEDQDQEVPVIVIHVKDVLGLAERGAFTALKAEIDELIAED